MSTPETGPRKRCTRSSTRRTAAHTETTAPELAAAVTESSSPILRGKKRPNSGGSTADEPASKKMAEDKILDAIKAVNTSVTSMEARMRSFTTKADLNVMVKEIKEVKEKVTLNTINIEKLFDLRKTDRGGLLRKVEEIVDNKIQSDERTTNHCSGQSQTSV